MKEQASDNNNQERLRKKYNIIVVLVILSVLLATTMLQGFFAWNSINDETNNRKRMEANAKNEKVENLKNIVANAIDNSAPAFGHQLDDSKAIVQLLMKMMRQNPELLGSAVAFRPGYYPERGQLFSPYAYREGNDIRQKLISYDYTQFDWYKNVMKSGKNSWCEPYADQDGTYELMQTYSVALRDSTGEIVAILTGDLPMSELKTSENDVYHQASQRSIIILVMQVIGILLIIVVAWRSIVSMRKLGSVDEEKESIEKEISIASRLQVETLPKKIPQHGHLGISASLVQAEQVSGDFYDYYLDGNRLYFCIGDVATHGLGAAMALIVARVTYRNCVYNHESPAQTMKKINRSLADIKEQQMFATMFAGTIDLGTGQFSYCNAGHLAPYVLKNGEADLLNVNPNVPLGIEGWEYQEQELTLQSGTTLFLYTDGIVEALNPMKESFGEKRFALHMKKASEEVDTPEALVKRITTAVSRHQGMEIETPNDDQSILVVRYR